MNTAALVDSMINGWKESGLSKSQICVNIAEACIGWSYVFGARGALCTPSNRNNAKRDAYPTIISKCQVCNGSKSSCSGCRWYPGGKTRFFDCRGFTYWVLFNVGIKIMGGGATTQYNDDNNWEEKGTIDQMPKDKLCCVFKYSAGKMKHTGLYIGNGNIVHCSGEVKRGKITDKGWTHYAIPKGLDGSVPIPSGKPTIRKGSTGVYVTECQNDLIKLGYSVGSTGADGKFGNNTEAGVKAFQKDHKLTVDGIVGTATWNELEKCLNESPTHVVKKYVVHIPHLTEEQAKEIINKYPEAYKSEE